MNGEHLDISITVLPSGRAASSRSPIVGARGNFCAAVHAAAPASRQSQPEAPCVSDEAGQSPRAARARALSSRQARAAASQAPPLLDALRAAKQKSRASPACA
eukprot:6213593-Pleurochrysis_carterae.AAC.1